MDPQRQQFQQLIDILQRCADPYRVAEHLAMEQLGRVEEMHRELRELFGRLVSLARLEQLRMPEAVIAEAWEGLHEMGQVRQQLVRNGWFDGRTRERCDRQAIPLLALVVSDVFMWAETASQWLERVGGLRNQIDAGLLRHAEPAALSGLIEPVAEPAARGERR